MKKVRKALSLSIALAMTLVLSAPTLAAPERVAGPLTLAQRVTGWVEAAVATMTAFLGPKTATVDQDEPLDRQSYFIEPNGVTVDDQDEPLDRRSFLVEPGG